MILDTANTFEVDIREDRVRNLESLVRASGVEVEQVRTRPDQRHHRHHRLLPDGIDRWVGHLCKALLEVVVEHLWTVREHGRWCVPAHRPDRVLSRLGHRLQEELDVLSRVSECPLRGCERRGIGTHRCDLWWEIGEMDLGLVEPSLVRLGTRQRVLEFLIGDDSSLFEVDEQHLAWLESPLLDDLVLWYVEHTHLRCHHDEVVVGYEVPRRS